uniref:Uncharacterized protein n=1 Tax=Cucumis melo TaxID=3656 RepID=A0A9I9E6N4_CUCME
MKITQSEAKASKNGPRNRHNTKGWHLKAIPIKTRSVATPKSRAVDKEIGKFFRARNPSSRIFSLHRLLPLVVISPYLSVILFRSPSLSITIAKLHIRSLTSREHHHCHRAIVVLLTLYHILKCHAITQPTEDQVSHGVHLTKSSMTIAEYKKKYRELSKYATSVIEDEDERDDCLSCQPNGTKNLDLLPANLALELKRIMLLLTLIDAFHFRKSQLDSLVFASLIEHVGNMIRETADESIAWARRTRHLTRCSKKKYILPRD